MNSIDAINKARQLMDDNGLIRWRIDWNQSKKTFGQCFYKRELITLSCYLTKVGREEDVIDTIKHEIAHALCYLRYGVVGYGHGKRWKEFCIMLGCRPVTKSRAKNVVQLKYVGQCDKCQVRYFRERRPVKQGTCTRCKSKFDFKPNPDAGKVIERRPERTFGDIFEVKKNG